MSCWRRARQPPTIIVSEAEAERQGVPRRGAREDRREQGDEVDAGLDHGRGVQVGAHRGGGGHGAGQPEVEGHERRLRQRADEQQHDGRDGDRVERRRVGEQAADRVGVVHADRDDADEHRETTEGRDEQRLHRRAPVRRARRVVSDEQVGQDRRQLPEDVEHEEVVGEDEAEHRAGEGGEDRREAPQRRVVVVEVPRAVEQDEGADAGDEQRRRPTRGCRRGSPGRGRDPAPRRWSAWVGRPSRTSVATESSQTNAVAGASASSGKALVRNVFASHGARAAASRCRSNSCATAAPRSSGDGLGPASGSRQDVASILCAAGGPADQWSTGPPSSRPVAVRRPGVRLSPHGQVDRHLGATRTVMALPCFELLTTVIVVPVLGTSTPYQPGW